MRFQLKLKGGFFLLAALSFLLSGCLPEEEVLPDAPVIKTAEIANYKEVEVIRGDIIDSVTIDCVYTALFTEDLKFSISQVPIVNLYIKEGDWVNKGEVLAELEMEDTKKQLEEYRESLGLLNLKLENQQELKQLTVSNKNRLKEIEGYTNVIENLYTGEIAVYDNEIQNIKDSMYIMEKRLNAEQEELENHRIIADMDGVVSYAATFNKGDISNKDLTYITLYHPDKMLFLTEGSNADKLSPGMKVTVAIASKEVEAEVVDFDNIELEGMAQGVYLKIYNKEENLQINDRGKITLILNQVKDVLYLPISVVHKENGKSIVYIEDEDGFKSIREIETGFMADRKVEILSGLKEGDSVILQ